MSEEASRRHKSKASEELFKGFSKDELAPVLDLNTPALPSRGRGSSGKKSMDPFEVRVRFTGLLANLNASVTSATKAAQYAIKYREMDEDLHSCIIEQLERVSVCVSQECTFS